MKQAAHRQQNHGFTFVEILAAVLILAILLALAAVGVVWYRDRLKIAELDNAARDIYMAAENRAVLLSGDERMQKLAQSGDALAVAEGTEARVLRKSTPNLVRLLPTGSIDPALWDGDFYIVCDPASGTITDVFYAEENLSEQIDAEGMGAFYTKWSGSSQSERMRAEPMIGYYGGAATPGRGTEDVSSPQMYVEVQNGERLTLTVSYWLPSGLAETDTKLEMKLLYGSGDDAEETGLSLDGRQIKKEQKASAGGTVYTRTYVLDELKAEEGRSDSKALQFKDLLLSGKAPGENFRVSATLSPAAENHFDEASAVSEENNSLFAKQNEGDEAGKATVSNLRHLQNLNNDFSGVKGKTEAVQADHIACYENGTYPKYVFKPIVNNQLKKYDGQEKQIRRLYITTASEGNASGLFARVDGSAGAPAQITGVYLLKAEIKVPASVSVGALMGTGSHVAVEKCYVQESTVSGGVKIGGLAGDVSNCAFKKCRVTDSAVDTNAASALAGGVAGNAPDSTFTECHIQGSTVETANAVAKAGGVAGQVVNKVKSGADNATFKECQAVNVAVNPATAVKLDTVGGGVYAGAIVGWTEKTVFDGCQVYWEPEEQNTLRGLLGSDAEGTGYKYQITGTNAGGLAGGAQNTDIQKSLAATLVQGGTVGGLIGKGRLLPARGTERRGPGGICDGRDKHRPYHDKCLCRRICRRRGQRCAAWRAGQRKWNERNYKRLCRRTVFQP